MLFPWLSVSVVGKEGINFTAVSSFVIGLAILFWWGNGFLHIGERPANVPDWMGTPTGVPPLMRIIEVSDGGLGVFSIETPKVVLTPAPVGSPSVLDQVRATATRSYQMVQAATGTAWALEQAHRSDLPACTPAPDDPCMAAWANAGLLDQYWQLWTPGVNLPAPATPVWFSTLSPDQENDLMMARILERLSVAARDERAFSEREALTPPLAGQGIRIP